MVKDRRIKLRNRKVSCPKCKNKMTRAIVEMGLMAKVWDSDKLYTNFGHEPMRFKTENDLRKKCRELKVNSGALL